MPEGAEDRKPERPRTWRPIALWSAGILAALALAWFVGAVAVPAWQARTIVAQYHAEGLRDPDTAIEQLGGPKAAGWKLRLYWLMPESWAPHRNDYHVVELLGYCRPSSDPAIIQIIRTKTPDPELRLCAIKTICFPAPPLPEAAPALVDALDHEWEPIHCYCIGALEQIGPAARCAIPALERELRTDHETHLWTRPDLAARALWAIAPERLEAALKDQNALCRSAAVEFLSGQAKNDPRARRALEASGLREPAK